MIIWEGVDATVPIEEREAFLRRYDKHRHPAAVILATCDRVEIYRGEGEPSSEVLEHLFRVVGGLESPLLGENQIQGQVKRAYTEASLKGGLTSGLHRLFQTALKVGKRIRTETALGQGAATHGHAVVKLLQAWEIPLAEQVVMLIGINNISRPLLKFLVAGGNRTFLLGNRTYNKSVELCAELGAGEAFMLDALTQKLPQSDVVICATSAPHFIIRPEQLPERGGPRLFIDLAVPRDIDPVIGLKPGVKLYNIEDLERILSESRQGRQNEVQAAELIVRDEVEKFFLRKT